MSCELRGYGQSTVMCGDVTCLPSDDVHIEYIS